MGGSSAHVNYNSCGHCANMPGMRLLHRFNSEIPVWQAIPWCSARMNFGGYNGPISKTTSNKKLLGAPGLTTRSDRTLLGAKGIATNGARTQSNNKCLWGNVELSKQCIEFPDERSQQLAAFTRAKAHVTRAAAAVSGHRRPAKEAWTRVQRKHANL